LDDYVEGFSCDANTLITQSQRDVSGQVPINFVTQPAVSLSAACFGNKGYDGEAASLCISKLLTVGYRRLIVDLYWSAQLKQWLFCPVSIPSSGSGDAGSQPSVHQLGPYNCTESFNVTTMTGVLGEYFQNTQQTTSAQFIYLIVNLHAAVNASSPDQPASALSGADLPSGSQLLGTVIDDALGPYIYGPPQLSQDRSNLNESWYRDTNVDVTPLASYFVTHKAPNAIRTTQDGWPCTSYLQRVANKRFLVGWGTVDPQMEGYDFSGDSPYIFSATEITSNVSVTPAADGVGLQSGCFYEPRVTDVSRVNSSWAESVSVPMSPEMTTDALGEASHLIQNLASCGISPVVNETLSGATADESVDLYRNLSVSSTWLWAIGEPQNISILDDAQNYDNTDQLYRCALMDLTVAGHWRAGNCSDEYHVACRVNGSPYSWVISSNKESFFEASGACPDHASFDVPRTGLENTYLYRTALSSLGDSHEQRVWVNFNSLDVQYCWVLGGPNASCGYIPDADDIERRTILVPTIAAIIILIITALTLFVKCNANRRSSRRRKRVIEGWEYEGVPS
jgi:hypothetical protein